MGEKINDYIKAVNRSWDSDTDAERREILYNMHKLYTDNSFKPFHKEITVKFREPIRTAYLSFKREMIE